jgi:glycosyltransferase involved in cell wall biosynthesis
MRVVMLGWEFPPFISGGLGTACYGLTKALHARGHQVMFVLPRPVDRSQASHIRLLSPDKKGGVPGASRTPVAGQVGEESFDGPVEHGRTTLPAGVRVVGVAAGFASPYGDGTSVGTQGGRNVVSVRPDGSMIMDDGSIHDPHADAAFADAGVSPTASGPTFGATGAGAGYKGDLIGESERYARLVVALARHEQFDVVHAHDWLTFPAGIALARVTGKPLIVHVHSTEFDRSGEHVNQRVYEIERRGMMSAMRVVCVSELTRSICTRRYGVPVIKTDVVYNGVENARFEPPPGSGIKSKDKIVLFLGRITMQKGPEYFIGAAKRVLEKVPEAKFLIAGAGDMETRMIELAAQLGIGHRVLFTGFLRGADVDRIFRMADCYVMPSVSEPFGIAPLEAMRNDVPVIISKQSGVSEVLTHALKVDFWDIDEMANKIVAVLKYPPLGQTLREHGSFELRKLTWDGAAHACEGVYASAIAGQRGLLAGVVG